MLNSNLRNALILIGFTFFLREYLTLSTILLVVLGVGFILVSYYPGKIIRNIMSIVLLMSYWFAFKKVFDPEVGLNFLTSVVVLKILEKENLRDQYMIFFGLVLLISSGSLFQKNIYYVLYFLISFAFLIKNFYEILNVKLRMIESFKIFFWITPLVILLFYLFPRAISPITFNPREFNEGEIGYNPDVKNSQFSKLFPSNQMAFQVETEKKLQGKNLYWRGNSVSFTDGWDWSHGPEDAITNDYSLMDKSLDDLTYQKIKLNFKSKFIFGLESPIKMQFSDQSFSGNISGNFIAKNISRYEVWSQNGESNKINSSLKYLIRTGLNLQEKKWIDDRFSLNKGVDSLILAIKMYFSQHRFTYSLNPGEILSFYDFVENKKTGVCTHYASSFALILRHFKIPTRLVSGFLGGEYNSYGNFYQIYQNDSHVWVEYFHQDKWRKIDPTLWIEPARLELPSDIFLSNLDSKQAGILTQLPFQRSLKELRMWLSQWDFKFYSWLEETDYFYQEEILNKFGLKRFWLFILVPLILLIFSTFIFLMKKNRVDEEEKLWLDFLKLLGVNKEYNFPRTINEIRDSILQKNDSRMQDFLKILNCLENYSFNNQGNLKKIKKMIRKY